jgi:phosphoglycolate phosphatase
MDNGHPMEDSLPLAKRKLEVNAVLFDLDGTLIDSAPIYYEIIDVVFEKLGIPPVSVEILREAMDDGEFDWDFVLPARMKNRKNQLIADARFIIDDIAPALFRKQIKLIPGVDRIFKLIAARNMKIGLVTSTPRDYISVKLAPLRKAAVEQCVYVGDTRVDIRAGNAAGMKTVGVLTGFDDFKALEKENPDAVLDSITQLDEVLDTH